MTQAQQSILIVEDDEDIREALVAVLDAEGFRTMAVENGKDALDLLGELGEQEDLPSLILLDVMMPIMDGKEFLRRKSQDERILPIPVAVLTAGMFSEPTLGVVEKIRKPVDLTDLLALAGRYAQAQSS